MLLSKLEVVARSKKRWKNSVVDGPLGMAVLAVIWVVGFRAGNAE